MDEEQGWKERQCVDTHTIKRNGKHYCVRDRRNEMTDKRE
jgi:hypothetical protein